MQKDFDDIPLSESNVSLRLADIQKRCSELLDGVEESSGLSLEDSAPEFDSDNPYDRG